MSLSPVSAHPQRRCAIFTLQRKQKLVGVPHLKLTCISHYLLVLQKQLYPFPAASLQLPAVNGLLLNVRLNNLYWSFKNQLTLPLFKERILISTSPPAQGLGTSPFASFPLPPTCTSENSYTITTNLFICPVPMLDFDILKDRVHLYLMFL